MSTELSIVQKENINLIVSNAPEAFRENTVSHDRCLEAGRQLLDDISQGMTDELDQRAASFIEKARKTVRKMNDKRTPLTKLFDEIRAQFTTMENDIDPAKAGTVPYLVQQQRNQYAAKKRQEEEQRQREAMRRQQEQQARQAYRASCDADYRASFRSYLDFYLDGMRELFTSVTLDNYDARLEDIQNTNITFPADYFSTVRSSAPLPMPDGILPPDSIPQIQHGSQIALFADFKSEFEGVLSVQKRKFLDLMPSKKQELEAAAKASAAEAERIRKEMEAREAEDRQRLEAERRQREEKERIEADMKAKKSEIGGLFGAAQASMPAYQPKASVKKKITLLNPEGIPEIISLWWTSEGCRLPVDELAKIFKKQIAFCERLANKEGRMIQSEHIYYEDEVKAK